MWVKIEKERRQISEWEAEVLWSEVPDHHRKSLQPVKSSKA
jgi:hypothetical protein